MINTNVFYSFWLSLLQVKVALTQKNSIKKMSIQMKIATNIRNSLLEGSTGSIDMMCCFLGSLLNERHMHIKLRFKVVLECWDIAIFENTRQISLGQMVPEIWLLLLENLVIFKLESYYRRGHYIIKKNYHKYETIWPRDNCLVFSKITISQHSRTTLKLDFTCIFLSFIVS